MIKDAIANNQAESEPFQALSLATEIPSRFVHRILELCLLPIYRSAVCTEAWPSRN
jgi:hypothetical protein